MQKLNLPEYSFNIKNENDKYKIFDEFRKKYVALTPEEWVRQNFLKWLTKEKKYPLSLISVEGGLRYNKLHKRSDAVIYDRNAKPAMIIEFKAPSVEIGSETVKQILSYNSSVNAPFIVVTNGINHYCLKRDNINRKFNFLEDIPDFESLLIDIKNI
ncbi:MAG: type I restriction enzyme HsdR N-terminal domain-containing protein [Bacteroidota bacterium]